MSKPDFWQDQDQAKIIGQKSENLKLTVQQWEDLSQGINNALELAKDAEKEADSSIEKELTKELHRLNKKFEKLEFLILFSQKYDSNDVILSIHAGTGGVEAQDWAAMLLRMYLRYCEKKGFVTKIIDESRGQEAGIKSTTLEINGYYAYGNLKSEAGVHRLVRISPFDAEKMRHTSFALVEAMPILPESEEVKISENDLKIETMKATGPGGQGVNTTDSAVRITHVPSGLTVKCQTERSQLQNRKTALKLLQAKLAKLQQAAQGKELAIIRGEVLAAEWGNQIRSYVLQPYKMVKDHRTNFETKYPGDVLDGELDNFVESYLKYINKASSASSVKSANLAD